MPGRRAEIAVKLSSMTFAMGRRVIIVDNAELLRESEVTEHLERALATIAPDTTIAFFAREEGRAKAPAALAKAVQAAGGQVATAATVKPWELPEWVRTQARRMGLELDGPASKALVAQVGERQQRLLRELEKLSLDAPVGGARISASEIEERAARSGEARAYALADALVARHAAAATAIYLRLRSQGERLTGLMYLMVSRVRDAHAVAARLEAGETPAQIKRTLRMPPRAADRFIGDVRRSDPERLRTALQTLADLELDTRGGAAVTSARSPLAGLDEDTQAIAAIARVAA